MAASGSVTSAARLRVLIDTNVALDQLLAREPWFSQAQPLWDARDASRLVAYLSTTMITGIIYIARRLVGNDAARRSVERCLREFGILAVTRFTLEQALRLPGNDFEGNVQIACGQAAHVDLIITRDAAGFQQSPILAIAPAAITTYLAP